MALLLVLALAMKAILPAGMMVERQDRRLTVALCAEGLGEHRTLDLVVPMERAPAGKKPLTADAPCPYGALGMAALPGADPALLAAAFAFLLARNALAPPFPALEPTDQLRPPLRGPPLTA